MKIWQEVKVYLITNTEVVTAEKPCMQCGQMHKKGIYNNTTIEAICFDREEAEIAVKHIISTKGVYNRRILEVEAKKIFGKDLADSMIEREEKVEVCESK